MANTPISFPIPGSGHFGVNIPKAPPLQGDQEVTFGQCTFNAEGSEVVGPYFSRSIHWPGGASGVTIGRGYDMGRRTRLQVLHELTISRVPAAQAALLSLAAGLRGESARRFVESNQAAIPMISLEAQKTLFTQVTTPEVIHDIKRILASKSVRAKYGETTWQELCPQVQELLFDLRYRGDYTPETREVLQPLISRNDIQGLAAVMRDSNFWTGLGVPAERVAQRAAIFDHDFRRMCA